jgi:formate/nitrite transporter FocA (FNT family)
MAYVYGTTEIVLKNPLGVGYSGFYDAMIQTDVYKSGVAAREVKPKEANPHMTFLWYSSTGGVFASFLSILLFFFLARISKISLQRVFGKPGLILFICFIGSMLMIAITVPYLFNSTIFYLPVAIIAGFAKSRLERGRGSDFLATSGNIPK